MKVICNKRKECDESNICAGAIPHKESENCSKCYSIDGQKCEPVEVKKVLNLMGEKHELKH